MRKYRLVIGFVLFISTLVAGTAAYADSVAKTIAVFKKSPSVQPFFENAYGYAVFPMIGKGGFVVGGAYGTGKVYALGTVTGTTRLIKATLGLQAGGQALSQMIFFEDKRAYEEFTSGNFEFDAGFSAVVITAGVQIKAGTEGGTAGASAGPATGVQAKNEYYKGMAVFIHAMGGLMYEAAIGGQKFSFQPLE